MQRALKSTLYECRQLYYGPNIYYQRHTCECRNHNQFINKLLLAEDDEDIILF